MKPFAITSIAVFAMITMFVLPNTGLTQNYNAEIRDNQSALRQNPQNRNTRERLVQLYYLQGTEYFKAGDLNNALETYRLAERTALDEKYAISPNRPAVEEARYGMAYILWKLDQPEEALTQLNNLTAVSPHVGKANYLAALIHDDGTPEGRKKSIDILKQMSSSPIEDTQQAGIRLLVAEGYNLSTIYAALDQHTEAHLLASEVEEVGSEELDTLAVKPHLLFASANYEEIVGDQDLAVAKLEELVTTYPDFTLGNGVSAREILANHYYQQGKNKAIDARDNKSEGEAQEALDLLEKSEAHAGTASTDLLHARYIAYSAAGDTENAATLKKTIEEDKDYIAQFKPAGGAAQ